MSEKTFLVKKPFAGHLTVEVQAENKEQADEKAWELMGKGEWKFKSNDGVELEELEIYDQLVQGSVCYVTSYETEIEEIED